MKELVAHLACALVDHPDQVKVNQEAADDETITIELTVAQDDLGKVIGKQGRTARAMRSLLSAIAARDGLKSRLDILE